MKCHIALKILQPNSDPSLTICGEFASGDIIMSVEEAENNEQHEISCQKCMKKFDAAFANRPCLHFCVPEYLDLGNEDESWFFVLRGYRMFRMIKKLTDSDPDTSHGKTTLSQGIPINPCPQEIMFVSMPAAHTEDYERAFINYSQKAFGMIVDVTADVLGLTTPTDAMKRAAAEKNTDEVREYWDNPDTLRRFANILRHATVITTSWEHLVGPLGEFFTCPVVHLPDLPRDAVTDEEVSKSDFVTTYRTKVMPALARAKGYKGKGNHTSV